MEPMTVKMREMMKKTKSLSVAGVTLSESIRTNITKETGRGGGIG